MNHLDSSVWLVADYSYGTTEVADHAIALALGLRRGIFLQHDHQRTPSPGWNTQDGPPAESFSGGVAEPLQGDLIQRPQNRVFGILGLGRIGIAVALRAKAFGWTVGNSCPCSCPH